MFFKKNLKNGTNIILKVYIINISGLLIYRIQYRFYFDKFYFD
jgi:hypothetical protein